MWPLPLTNATSPRTRTFQPEKPFWLVEAVTQPSTYTNAVRRVDEDAGGGGAGAGKMGKHQPVFDIDVGGKGGSVELNDMAGIESAGCPWGTSAG
eukprot:365124-Chlamydomonas_euryale.AAC.11